MYFFYSFVHTGGISGTKAYNRDRFKVDHTVEGVFFPPYSAGLHSSNSTPVLLSGMSSAARFHNSLHFSERRSKSLYSAAV